MARKLRVPINHGLFSLFGPEWWGGILHSTASRWTHYQNAEMDQLIAVSKAIERKLADEHRDGGGPFQREATGESLRHEQDK